MNNDDLEAMMWDLFLGRPTSSPLSLLIKAIEDKKPISEITKLIFDNKIDVNVSYDKLGFGYFTPLVASALHGFDDILKLLLSLGARTDPHSLPDNGFRYPLLYAAQNDHDHTIKILLTAGANINAEHSIMSNSALMESVGHPKAMQTLIAAGAIKSIRLADKALDYAIYSAIYSNIVSRDGLDATTKLLLEARAYNEKKDIKMDNTKWTKFFLAICDNQAELAEILASYGVNVSIQNFQIRAEKKLFLITPLAQAIKDGNPKLIAITKASLYADNILSRSDITKVEEIDYAPGESDYKLISTRLYHKLKMDGMSADFVEYFSSLVIPEALKTQIFDSISKHKIDCIINAKIKGEEIQFNGWSADKIKENITSDEAAKIDEALSSYFIPFAELLNFITPNLFFTPLSPLSPYFIYKYKTSMVGESLEEEGLKAIYEGVREEYGSIENFVISQFKDRLLVGDKETLERFQNLTSEISKHPYCPKEQKYVLGLYAIKAEIVLEAIEEARIEDNNAALHAIQYYLKSTDEQKAKIQEMPSCMQKLKWAVDLFNEYIGNITAPEENAMEMVENSLPTGALPDLADVIGCTSVDLA